MNIFLMLTCSRFRQHVSFIMHLPHFSQRVMILSVTACWLISVGKKSLLSFTKELELRESDQVATLHKAISKIPRVLSRSLRK